VGHRKGRIARTWVILTEEEITKAAWRGHRWLFAWGIIVAVFLIAVLARTYNSIQFWGGFTLGVMLSGPLLKSAARRIRAEVTAALVKAAMAW